jgi:hypothetical protein
MFIHTVYFWLKPNTPSAAVDQLLADCHQLLTTIPSVRHLWAGRPANTPRDVVDNSYAVGLTVILEDSAGHDVYQTHEAHLQFIARHKANWQRVQIYDFV